MSTLRLWPPLAGAGSGKTHLSQLGCGEESAGSDGAVLGGVGALFGVGFGAQLRRAVAVFVEAFEGASGFGAQFG